MLPALRSRLDVSFVIANGENAAGGFGITKTIAKSIFDAGADVITLGNHTWAKRDSWDFIDQEARILRPANYGPGTPGRGYGTFKAQNGRTISVINMMGRTFMSPLDCPFRTADTILTELGDNAGMVFVDMHAEATSEKIALGYYLDGRVSSVVGTHTHVQTSDERVLPCGSAYITDAGMTGAVDSVLGLDPQEAIRRFITQMPGKVKPAEGEPSLQGVLIDVDPVTSRATSISRVSVCSTEQF